MNVLLFKFYILKFYVLCSCIPDTYVLSNIFLELYMRPTTTLPDTYRTIHLFLSLFIFFTLPTFHFHYVVPLYCFFI